MCAEFSSRRARDQLRYRRAGTAVGEAGCNDDLDIDVDEVLLLNDDGGGNHGGHDVDTILRR